MECPLRHGPSLCNHATQGIKSHAGPPEPARAALDVAAFAIRTGGGTSVRNLFRPKQAFQVLKQSGPFLPHMDPAQNESEGLYLRPDKPSGVMLIFKAVACDDKTSISPAGEESLGLA